MSSAARPALVELLVSAFQAGLAELDPADLVERALDPPARGLAALRGPGATGRIALLAVGKAALAMARGARRAWGDRIEGGLVVTIDGPGADEGALGGIEVCRAAHPIPDERSVAAAEAALALAGGLGPDDQLLALVSGGASALLAAPPLGVPLADKRALVAALLDAGAPIHDVNLVRRHLSRVKGGRVAAATAPAAVLTLILSDVIGGLPHDIGSGPTVPDPTRLDDALAALRRWAPAYAHLAPALAGSPPRRAGPPPEARVLAEPATLAERTAAALCRAGLRARAAPAEQGEARVMTERRIALARALSPGEAIVLACEPTLALPARRGAGGRAGWVALAAMRALPPDTALLCAASDGVDGSSGAAGAVVTRAAADAAGADAIDAALTGFDDAPLHRALGTRIEGAPTGHNLADLHIVARAL